MNRVPSEKKSVNQLSDEEKRSLEILLGDEDRNTFQALEKLILKEADRYVDWLKTCQLSENAIVRRHARSLLCRHLSMTSKVRFLIFCHTQPENLNLEQGLFALAQTEYPEINVDGYSALIDYFADEIKTRINRLVSPHDILEAVNNYLFEIEGFSGNHYEYYAPENNYINKVIDERVGNPVGLCCLYWIISSRLNLPVTGIGMPGHFLIRYQDNREEIYVDAFNQGRLLNRKDCMRLAVAMGLEFHNSLLSPTSSRSTLIRICSNLASSYGKRNMSEKSERSRLFISYLNRQVGSAKSLGQ